MAVFFLNLPRIVKNSTNGSLEYIYDAAGNKLAKKLNGVFVNFYCGSVVYTGSKAVKYVMHSQGMARPNGSNWDYQYNLTDHLGNVRYVTDVNKTFEQRTDYFPFGLGHSTSPIELAKNKYLYNGKELQTELGYEALDYGVRRYDPRIIQWNGIDPLTEQSRRWSPYVYCYDNPIIFIDPDGMDPKKYNFFQRADQWINSIKGPVSNPSVKRDLQMIGNAIVGGHR